MTKFLLGAMLLAGAVSCMAQRGASADLAASIRNAYKQN